MLRNQSDQSVELNILRQVEARLSFDQKFVFFAQFLYRLRGHAGNEIAFRGQLAGNNRTYPNYTLRNQRPPGRYPNFGSDVGQRTDIYRPRALTIVSPQRGIAPAQD